MRIFNDLLMLHGYIADPRLARELAGVPDDDRHAPQAEAPAKAARDRPSASDDASRPPPRPCPDAGSADAHFRRGVTTLCATALSLFR